MSMHPHAISFECRGSRSRSLDFLILEEELAITRLHADAPVPHRLLAATGFFSISRTSDELSIVCEARLAGGVGTADLGWRAIKLIGPFAFDQTGILCSCLVPLAQAGIGIFAISTYDTDYILVKSSSLSAAVRSLEAAGHRRVDPSFQA